MKNPFAGQQWWDGVGGGRDVREGGDICIPMVDAC